MLKLNCKQIDWFKKIKTDEQHTSTRYNNNEYIANDAVRYSYL